MKRLPRKDVTGQRLKVGDIVRVVGLSDVSGISEPYRAESLRVFQHLVGEYKRIRNFDEWGLAWLSFTIRKGPSAGSHSVGIEPYLLRLRRPNKP